MHDLSTNAVHVALRGLAARQRTIADNVANVETPGFIAKRVSFEDSLRAATSAGSPSSAVVSAASTESPVNAQGNNVQLDEESIALIDTGLRYQLMTEAMSAKFRTIRAAIGKGA